MENERKLELLGELYKRIEKSAYFKSLEGKTQVLNLAVERPELGLTNRAIHSEQVAENAATLVSLAGGSQEEIMMARIIGLSHDLGHTPMGHAGEAALAELLQDEEFKGFRHSHYSAKIFEQLVDEFCLKRSKEMLVSMSSEEKECILEEITYLQEKKAEMSECIQNHDVYYGKDIAFYQTDEEKKQLLSLSQEGQKENVVGNCTRLADSISFMCSDMHDLMKGTFENGETVISEKEAREFFDGLKNQSGYENLQVESYFSLIARGQEGVKEMQKQICKEVVSARGENGRLETISDDYKYTREIHKGMEYAKAYPEAASKYLPIDSVMNFDRLHKNDPGYRPLTEKEKGSLKEAGDRFKEDIPEQTREAIEKNCSELIGNYYSRNKNYLDGVRKREREKLWREKPMLATAFEYQDEKQYNEIILKNQTQKLNNAERQTKEDIETVYAAKKEEGRALYTEGTLSQKNAAPIPFTGNKATDYAIQKVQTLTNETLRKEASRIRKASIKERIAQKKEIINQRESSKNMSKMRNQSNSHEL